MYLEQVRQKVFIERREPLKASEVTRKIKKFLKKEENSNLPPSTAVHLMKIKESSFLNESISNAAQ
jgi:hypothetical protein